MSKPENPGVLKFAPFQSCVDASFWSELGEQKLHALKLSETPVRIHGWVGPSRYVEVPSQLHLDAESFTKEPITSADEQGGDQGIITSTQTAQSGSGKHSLIRSGLHAVPGILLNTNTLQAFKAMDRQQMLRKAAAQVWQDILSGAAEQDPSRLSSFMLTAHGDLKQFKFHYWFASPALKPPAPFTAVSKAQLVSQSFGPEAATKVTAACDRWRGSGHAPAADPGSSVRGPAPFWMLHSASGTWQDAQALPLSAWASLRPSSSAGKSSGVGIDRDAPTADAQGPCSAGLSGRGEVMLAFSDPCNLAEYPGWPLRNALLMAAVRWGVKELKVLCVRDHKGRTSSEHSLLLQVSLPSIPEGWCSINAAPSFRDGKLSSADVPEAVGWEANKEGKLLPRLVDLGPLLSSHQLAEQAVDLNLMLMRWRASPNLNVEALSRSKCLLLGAGTLGCAVARTLLAWGVRDITFVDSSHVSCSNPVRQSLYEFEDCEGGGKAKAEAAAKALQRIFPLVRSQGFALSIPMPGHPPLDAASQAAMEQDAGTLDSLVAEHDAVFLLTDTRESRWLPSLLAAVHGKIAITSAIGFDSFLVMRHGGPPNNLSSQQGPRLGCYFCNDVFAPVNSTQDRALDQQCTVARPGLAPIAGALCVEVLAALVQHPQQVGVKPLGGSDAEWEWPQQQEQQEQQQPLQQEQQEQRQPLQQGQLQQLQQQHDRQQQLQQLQPQQSQQHPQQQSQHQQVQQQHLGGRGGRHHPDQDEAFLGALGGVPHMLRGNLTGFSLTCMEGRAFNQCTACSATVVQRYKQQPCELVLRAIKEPSYLEEVTGLAALQQAMQQYEASTEARVAGQAAEGEGSGSGDEWLSL